MAWNLTKQMISPLKKVPSDIIISQSQTPRHIDKLADEIGINNGVDSDVAGTIDFFTNDTYQNNRSFGEIKVVATSATSGSEEGTMTFGVASSGYGGNVTTLLTILTSSIDVNGSINSTGSISCIGNLDVSASSSDDGKINCANDLNIAGNINIATDKKITWVDDNQYISGTATGITIEADDTLTVNASTTTIAGDIDMATILIVRGLFHSFQQQRLHNKN